MSLLRGGDELRLEVIITNDSESLLKVLQRSSVSVNKERPSGFLSCESMNILDTSEIIIRRPLIIRSGGGINLASLANFFTIDTV